MQVLIVHNDYGVFSGEEAFLAAQKKLLEDRGRPGQCREPGLTEGRFVLQTPLSPAAPSHHSRQEGT